MHKLLGKGLFWCTVSCILVLAGSVSLAAPPEQGNNLLVNPGFEGEFRQTSRSSHVAEGWYSWYYHTGPGSKYYEPEWKVIQRPLDDGSADIRARLLDGNRSQQWFNTYALHRAGLWQRVKVPRNSRVTFAIWVQILSARDNHWVNDTMVSGPKDLGNYQVLCGIDPTGWEPQGQVLEPPASVAWSNPVWDYQTKAPDGSNQWAPIQITAQAQGDYVTVWVYGYNTWAYRYEAAFVDKASLVVVGAPAPVRAAATAKPTNTPVPTSTPTVPPTLTPTVTPTYTPTPTATPTFTPTPTFAPTPTFTPTPTSTYTPIPFPTPTLVRRASPTSIVVNAVAAGSIAGAKPGDSIELLVLGIASVLALGIGLFVGSMMGRRPKRV